MSFLLLGIQFVNGFQTTILLAKSQERFCTGTENPADEEHRQQVAVEKATGGSYVVSFHLFKAHPFNHVAFAKMCVHRICKNKFSLLIRSINSN